MAMQAVVLSPPQVRHSLLFLVLLNAVPNLGLVEDSYAFTELVIGNR